MPTFDTPAPIALSIALVNGGVRVTASTRTDTVVQVSPEDPSNDLDLRAAEQTTVDFTSGRVVIRGPRPPSLGLFGKVGCVAVVVDLPADSDVDVEVGVGAVRCAGPLADCRLKSGAGDVQIEQAGTLNLHTGFGTATVGGVTGDATVNTGSGRLSVTDVGGRAVLKNGNGDTWIGAAGGDLKVRSANGQIIADHAGASVVANTANGDIRVGELVRGAATLRSAAGRIQVGIRTGTAALLDLHTHFGKIQNEMETVPAGPVDTEERAEVRARTAYGDILIHRPTP
jgi:DUF4097 and DUF4098 domain-containing protein YvlB